MKFTTLIAAFLAPIAVMATAVAEPVNVESRIGITDNKKGQLYVKLNHATDLTKKDWFGRNDPFIEMWLEKDYKQRSKDTKGQNPVFNETFCFYVRPGQNKLHVRAVDLDTLKNDKIGETTISLDQVLTTGTSPDQDYKLPKWLGFSDNGSVNLRMHFIEDLSA